MAKKKSRAGEKQSMVKMAAQRIDKAARRLARQEEKEKIIRAQWTPIETVKRKKLTREEEVEIISRAQAGDLEARNNLIVWNVPFIHIVVRRMLLCEYYRKHSTYQDMVQAGVFGLARAIEKFDSSKRMRLITYAGLWIKETIQKEVLNGALYRMPMYAHQKQFKKTNQKTLDAVERFHKMTLCVSTEMVRNNPIAVEDDYDNREYVARIKQLINSLPHQQRAVIKRRLNGETLKSIGQKVGGCGERIRQIEIQAHEALKKRVQGTTLEPYWWLNEEREEYVETAI